MKLLLLLASAAAFAGPVIEHPNSLVSLPAPEIKNTFDLDIEDLRRQNPQYDVSFDGGLVGLFSRVPEAPIFTTPAVWFVREEPNFERFGMPGTGTPIFVPPTIPDCDHPIIDWIRDHFPHHPHTPPDGPAVPEPAGSLMIAAGLGLSVWATRRFR
jgi:hypothetical protein